MATIGLALMLEQLDPTRAVELSEQATDAGFEGVMAADVFQPWLPTGQAPFLWNVLTASAPLTHGPLGAVVTPTYRWHPATLAQASATFAAMFPGRHWLGLSAGEALNDAVTGEFWPGAPERIARMFESADLIGKLFANSAAGRDTRFAGERVSLEASRLWTTPPTPPRILIATAGPVTARRAGRQADGFITMGADLQRVATLMSRFHAGAREAGKPPDSVTTVARLHLSWAPTQEEAVANALAHWPQAAMRFPTVDIRSPYDFAQIAKLVRPEDFGDRVLITSDPDKIRSWAQQFIDLGFDEIYLHNVDPHSEEWLEVARNEILPKLTLN